MRVRTQLTLLLALNSGACGIPHPGVTFKVIDVTSLTPIVGVITSRLTYHEGYFDDTYTATKHYPPIGSDGLLHTGMLWSNLAYTFNFEKDVYSGDAVVSNGCDVMGNSIPTSRPGIFTAQKLHPDKDGVYVILMQKR